MSVRTPEPRLPLEPEEYPIYRPPSRIGCSAISIITLLTLIAFAVLISQVTPRFARSITEPFRGLFQSGTPEAASADVTPGSGPMSTQTVPVLTPTTAVIVAVSPTPTVEYVKVANTGGQGVKLRKQPTLNSSWVVTVGEGAIFQVVGPDQKDADPTIGTWRHVELPGGDGRQGWVLSKYLIASNGPNP